jgi:signal transduction histidine kinase/ligand-binding sensor domain-containing protein
MAMRLKIIAVAFLMFHSDWSLAVADGGLPFIRSYLPKEYGQGTQNFAVLQDRQGMLYFGNYHGVLTFDGHTWGLIEVANKSEVLSLAADEAGRIYVGAQGDFGYLRPNPAAQRHEYVSLLHLVPEAHRNFDNVWGIYFTRQGTVFHTASAIYTYLNGKIGVTPVSSSTHRTFFVSGEMWMREAGFGLRKFNGRSFEPLPGGDSFKEEEVYAVLPYPSNRWLVVADKQGLLLYDGQRFTPFASAANDLIRNQPVRGRQLSDGTYALGTRFQGVVIIDADGRILYHINRKDGLADESVWDICQDRYSGNLWVATNNGISFLEINSPFRMYERSSGLDGQIYTVNRHQGDLVATSSLGVFVLRNGASKFEPLPELRSQSWHSYSDGASLLASTNHGIFEVSRRNVRNVGYTGRAWFLFPIDSGRVLANTPEGFLILEKRDNRYAVLRKLRKMPHSLYHFAKDDQGNIWADSPIKGVYRLRLPERLTDDISGALYNGEKGFPSDFRIFPFQFGNEVRFGTESGIYRYDAAADAMRFDETLNAKVFGADRPNIERMYQDAYGNLWFVLRVMRNGTLAEVGGFAIRQSDGSYKSQFDLFWRIQNQKIRSFLALDSLRMLIGTSEGVLIFNRRQPLHGRFPVVLKEVVLTRSGTPLPVGGSNLLSIPFQRGGIRFAYAGMAFSAVPHEYQTQLTGIDADEPVWEESHTKEYARLPEGSYVFTVRARNAYNVESEAAHFPFEVTAPWFRKPWALAVFFVGLVGLVGGFVRYRSYALMAQNKRLEAVIRERTDDLRKQNEEIVQKNRELEWQKEEIEMQRESIEKKNAALESARDIIHSKNEELKQINTHLEQAVAERTRELETAYRTLLDTKNELDTFIYRSSHDIKGPLLRLLGLCNVALMEVKDDTACFYLKMLEKEIKVTNRILQKLIVFHHVKNAPVKPASLNIATVVAEAAQKLEDERRNFNINMEVSDLDIEAVTDKYLLGVAVENLVENAIQFRRDQPPKVYISAARSNGMVSITVSDNGRGITEASAQRIFDMFYRGTEASNGAGLGLFITRQAMTKIGGRVYFEMRELTTFVLEFPVELAVSADKALIVG